MAFLKIKREALKTSPEPGKGLAYARTLSKVW